MTVQELGKSRVVAAAASVDEAVVAGSTWWFAFGAIVVERRVSVRTFSEAFGQIQVRIARELVTLGASVGVRTLRTWERTALAELGRDFEAADRALIREAFLLRTPIIRELVFARGTPGNVSRLIILSACQAGFSAPETFSWISGAIARETIRA